MTAPLCAPLICHRLLSSLRSANARPERSFARTQFTADLMPSDLIQRERLNLDEQGHAPEPVANADGVSFPFTTVLAGATR